MPLWMFSRLALEYGWPPLSIEELRKANVFLTIVADVAIPGTFTLEGVECIPFNCSDDCSDEKSLDGASDLTFHRLRGQN